MTASIPGIKHDTGKLMWHLVPWEELEEVVRVYTHGAEKYGPHNWKSLDNPRERYFSALMRHLTAWRKGEQTDRESGLYHLAQVAWNALALLWFENGKGEAHN